MYTEAQYIEDSTFLLTPLFLIIFKVNPKITL